MTPAVQTCYETGLMDGKSATAFDPQGSLTYGQIVVIVARLHELMNGGDGKFDPPAEGEAWYQPASDYLLGLPILNETDETTTRRCSTPSRQLPLTLWAMEEFEDYASRPCTRYDFIFFLAAILPEDALEPINSITSLPDVTQHSVILDFYNAGILTAATSTVPSTASTRSTGDRPPPCWPGSWIRPSGCSLPPSL